MTAKNEIEEQGNQNATPTSGASAGGGMNAPAHFDFDTIQSSDLSTGFRAPPTSPCNTIIGGGAGMSSMISKLQIENCTLPHTTPQDLELQNEMFKRKRGRKSVPHVATLFSSSPTTSTQNKNDRNDDSVTTLSSSSLPSSSSLFDGGAGNHPPPNSPEQPISNSTNDQNLSMLAELSCNSISDNQEDQSTSSPTSFSPKTERAVQLSQLKTQLHLNHKLEQIRQTTDSNAHID